MLISRNFLAGLLALFALGLAGSYGLSNARLPVTESQNSPAKQPRVQWEYCVIEAVFQKSYDSRSDEGATAVIRYLNNAGSGIEWVTAERTKDRRAAMSKAIAKLGDDGWELTGMAPLDPENEWYFSEGSGRLSNPFFLYFKRMK